MKKSFAQSLFLFFALALAVSSADAQSSAAPPADLAAYAERARTTFEVPGLSVAIVKDGQVVFARGFGVKKLGESAPVDENTLYGIGSNTKAFTTAALASLVDAGKLNWDDKVYERLPGFAMYDPYVSHEMTIRDLLTHRSGMGLGEGDLLFWPHTTYTREEIIHKLRFMKPASSFRSHYAYDNLLYMTAGQIIPAVTGQSWESYIQQHILDPLGMKTTNLSNTLFKTGDNYAFPHERLDGKLQTIDFVALDNAGPAGSINSSVAEMAKWITLQLNHGKYPNSDQRLFSERQHHELWSPQTILPVGPPTDSPSSLNVLRPQFADYALGWGVHDYRGHKLVGHTGGVAGFVTRVMLVPDQNLGIVILTNAEEEGAFDSILYHIIDHYLSAPPTDWIAALKQHREEEIAEAAEITKQADAHRVRGSSPSLPLDKYAAVYTDPWYGPATIKLENGKLVFTLDHTPAAVGDLEHYQFNTFRSHWRSRTIEDAYLTFTITPDGQIDHFTMSAVSPLADFSFDYQDLYFTPFKH